MKARQVIVAMLGVIVVAATVLSVNAISGRQSLAASRRSRAAALEAQAAEVAGRIPDSYRADTRLLTGKLWAGSAVADLTATAEQASMSFGLTWLNVGKDTASRLLSDADDTLGLSAADNASALRPLTAVIAVAGDLHQVNRFLEYLQASGSLLILSPVEFTFSTNSATATLAVSAVRLVGLTAGRTISSDGSVPKAKIPMAQPTSVAPKTTVSTTVTPKVPG